MRGRKVLIGSMTAGMLAGSLFVGQAQAVPTCPRGATPTPWSLSVTPDRNDNGFVCMRMAGQNGSTLIFTDDRDV